MSEETTPTFPSVFEVNTEAHKTLFQTKIIGAGITARDQVKQLYLKLHSDFWNDQASQEFVPGVGNVMVAPTPLSRKQRVLAMGTRAVSTFQEFSKLRAYLVDTGVPEAELPGIPAGYEFKPNADGSATLVSVELD